MKSVDPSSRVLWLDQQGRLLTIDQTRLPFETIELELASAADCEHAIRTMQVRGAPLIGAVGAYGLAWATHDDASDDGLRGAAARLLATRPTAVNLRWALQNMQQTLGAVPVAQRAAIAWQRAAQLSDEIVEANRLIGQYALDWLAPLIDRLRAAGRPLNVLTHCNAGPLATLAWGTALSPVLQLSGRGVPVHVWVDETRPRNQGASLTCWELARAGVAHTLVADNTGGLLMMQGRVDVVIVGCDRVAANGDVANKVGTYLKALAAHAHAVPFLVACPGSTIDLLAADGAAIAIEERDAREVTMMRGRDPSGRVTEIQIAPDGTPAINPAFDITPAALVTALLTERGCCAAEPAAIRGLFGQAA